MAFDDEVMVMIYVRPNARGDVLRVTPAPVIKPVATVIEHDQSAAQEQAFTSHQPAQNAAPLNTIYHEDRRRQDRRQSRKSSLLETRAGRDRRKSHPSISITV